MKGQFGFVGVLPASKARAERRHWWRALGWQLRRWYQLAHQRRQLAMLSDEALKDIGLSRADTMQESELPFWDDPSKR
ncbi:DUF1127 domain-containing protein [Pseudomonas sp. LS44]|uniref:DUF1127 domain-containing protein n=1 Tax=Pseudomonas sp. LS44 TaxID=1357074 RepID=UPI00215A9839|nr:DUF1127 domain-containing protein [Pseudomonas sp. LS44]UVE16211.1 DUF1127 domain-containing protein [Pseudomonas sp. LS44]